VAVVPIGWTYDASARRLELQWHPARDVVAPTVIVVPARLAPAGVTVDCACTVEIAGDEVHLTDATGDPATAVVQVRM
jgi:hypothetical protein